LADLDLARPDEMLDRHSLPCVLITEPVRELRRDRGPDLVPGALAGELHLEPRDDVVAAVQVRDRVSLLRRLRERAFLVGQRVVKGHYLVFRDFHDGELEPIPGPSRKGAHSSSWTQRTTAS